MAAIDTLDWRLLQVFLVAAEAGSLGRAAAALGDSQPTLSRRLAELEAALGQALFERSPRGLSPTAAGSALLGPARRMQQQTRQMALAMERHAGTLAGRVRVTASEMVSQHLLLPALRPLREQHPQIQIELAPLFRPREPALIARRLADLPLGLYAHRDYLARHGKVMPASLAQHHWIGADKGDEARRGFAQACHPVAREFFAIRTDHSALAWQAVCEGLGIGVGLRQVAERNADLVRVLADIAIPPMACWLVVHRELRGTPRLRAVADALAAALGPAA